MEDKLPDRHRSPRLIARLQELSTTEDVEERKCHRQLDAHQTDSQLIEQLITTIDLLDRSQKVQYLSPAQCEDF
ncbi:hypothetical protein C5167_009677 [Papaver somniferum]|uniref:Uncharacterized protein n=1 Tax=Papaver somniferum TaxID=3469 RepID=A0A4Y7JY20_PAPSO|nr:hypothetical protein C5167_009677 [Papaver somniferum]